MIKGYSSLIVLMGLPSSGKSTIAAHLVKQIAPVTGIKTVTIGTDEMRRKLTDNQAIFDPSIEPEIKKRTLNAILAALQQKFIVINDDMNYYKSMRHELKEIAENNHAHFILIHIDVPLQIALDWNQARGLPIPQNVIKRVYDRFDLPGDYTWDTPLMTIRSDIMEPDVAARTILAKLLPIIQTAYTPEISLSQPKAGLSEDIDKITRQIISELTEYHTNKSIMKEISTFRKNYVKTLEKTLSLQEIKQQFAQHLKDFLASIKRAK